MKLIIAGSRGATTYDLIIKAMKYFNLHGDDIDEVVSGTAKGADTLGEEWAANNDIKVKQFPAEWSNLNAKPCSIRENQYGKYNAMAGLNRNKEMAVYADCLLAIWDGESRGTLNMIETMENMGKTVHVWEI